MKTPSVAIVKCDFHDNHSTSWSHAWLDYCQDKNIPHCLIDWREYNAYKKLVKYDIVLWHISHYSHEEMIFARNILNSLKAAGCRVYPDNSDADHFDDKIAQSYLLDALGLPTPTNYVLHSGRCGRRLDQLRIGFSCSRKVGVQVQEQVMFS